MKRIGNELANLDEQLLRDLVNIVKIYTWKISDLAHRLFNLLSMS
jgi:hypothetical protein